MKYLFATLLTLNFFSTICYGQLEQLQSYKSIFRTADSLNKLGQIFSIDSSTFQDARQLDQQHPSKFFEKTGELIKNHKYNDAAFVYYLGLLRYGYYNSANPKYEPSGDGALAGSFRYLFGEIINLYLKTNIDYFESALKISSEYYAKNDYLFYPKNNNLEKYNEFVDSYSKLINELETNREKYQKQWGEERKSFVENIDKAIDDYNQKKNQN